MAKSEQLHEPWLVAVWPGMGNVALGAGTYLVEKLGAKWLANLSARDLFDVDHVDFGGGLGVRYRAELDSGALRAIGKIIATGIGQSMQPYGRF